MGSFIEFQRNDHKLDWMDKETSETRKGKIGRSFEPGSDHELNSILAALSPSLLHNLVEWILESLKSVSCPLECLLLHPHPLKILQTCFPSTSAFSFPQKLYPFSVSRVPVSSLPVISLKRSSFFWILQVLLLHLYIRMGSFQIHQIELLYRHSVRADEIENSSHSSRGENESLVQVCAEIPKTDYEIRNRGKEREKLQLCWAELSCTPCTLRLSFFLSRLQVTQEKKEEQEERRQRVKQ